MMTLDSQRILRQRRTIGHRLNSRRVNSRSVNSHCVIACLVTSLLAVTSELPAQVPAAGNNGVAVLSDGRIVQGELTEVPGGYRVTTSSGGQFVIPFDQISVTSASIAGAYEAYRDSIKSPTAETHLMLAEWCMGNGLWAQAYAEVQSALKLEPMRQDAHLLLKRLDTYLAAQDVYKRGQKPSASAPASPPVIVEEEPRPAAAPRSVHVTYVTRVQPILMNSCGNGACHGQIAKNEFRLKNVRLESRNLKIASEENLTTLQDWIDFDRPENSPLLVHASDGAPHHRALFAGRRHAQYVVIEEWIRQLVSEQKKAFPAPVAATPTRSGVVPVSAERVVPQPAPEKSEGAFPAVMPGSQAPEIQQARRVMRPDAFDPAAFNQMMQQTP